MHICRYLLLLGIVCSPCFAAPSTNDVPLDIKGVVLGMDWKSFLALGRDVELMNAMPDKPNRLTPDPNQPKRSLTEKLTKGPFDRVVYGFEDGKLTSVMIGGEVRKDRGNRAGVLRRVLSQYGMPDTIGVMRAQKSHGVLKWHGNNVQIRALLPAKDETGFVSIQVLSDSVAQKLDVAEKTEAPKSPADTGAGTEVLTTSLDDEVRAVLDDISKTKSTPHK